MGQHIWNSKTGNPNKNNLHDGQPDILKIMFTQPHHTNPEKQGIYTVKPPELILVFKEEILVPVKKT
jgi:hypothetical protein